MKHCSNCKKRIWFWNRCYREYGKGFLISRNKGILEKVNFCSEKCILEYKTNFLIHFPYNKRYLKNKNAIQI